MVVVVVVLIMVAGAAGYAANNPKTVVSTFTTTTIVGTYDIQQITSNVTTTRTTTIIKSGNFPLEYNFTGNGTISEDDLLGLIGNYTTTYSSTTHLQWVNNATVFNFNATSASSACLTSNNDNSTFDCTLILNGFGAAYFGNGQQLGNSTRWVGTFVINNSSPSDVASYFSSLSSFMSVRGLKVVSTSSGVPEGLVTVTELIIINYVESLAVYTSGTCSWVAGTAFVNSSVTTEYIFPSNINNTSEHQFLNITITTVKSNMTNLTSSTTTTITLIAASQNTST